MLDFGCGKKSFENLCHIKSTLHKDLQNYGFAKRVFINGFAGGFTSGFECRFAKPREVLDCLQKARIFAQKSRKL